MAESRNLCGFEKNVLLALIAAVIQPDKVLYACMYVCMQCLESIGSRYFLLHGLSLRL